MRTHIRICKHTHRAHFIFLPLWFLYIFHTHISCYCFTLLLYFLFIVFGINAIFGRAAGKCKAAAVKYACEIPEFLLKSNTYTHINLTHLHSPVACASKVRVLLTYIYRYICTRLQAAAIATGVLLLCANMCIL